MAARADYDAEDLNRKTYVVAVNQTDRALTAFDYITKFLSRERDKVVLLYCLEKSAATLREMREKFEFLSELAGRLRERSISHRCFVKKGKAKKLIVAFARELNASVIVLGTRARSMLKRFVLGSVSAHVIAHAPCSVLAVIDNKVTRANREAGTPATARNFLCYVDGSDMAHAAFNKLVTEVAVADDKVTTFSLLPLAASASGSPPRSAAAGSAAKPGAAAAVSAVASAATTSPIPAPSGGSRARASSSSSVEAAAVAAVADASDAAGSNAGPAHASAAAASAPVNPARANAPHTPELLSEREKMLSMRLATYASFAQAYQLRTSAVVLGQARPLERALRAAAKTYQVDGLVLGVPGPEAVEATPRDKALVDVAVACVQKAVCNVVLIVKYVELDTTASRFDMDPQGARIHALRARVAQLNSSCPPPSSSATDSAPGPATPPRVIIPPRRRKRATSFAELISKVEYDEDEPPAAAGAASPSRVAVAGVHPLLTPKASGSMDLPTPVTPAAGLQWDEDSGEGNFVVSSSSEYTGSYYSTASDLHIGSSLSLSTSSHGSVDSAFLDFLEDVGAGDKLMTSIRRRSSSSMSDTLSSGTLPSASSSSSAAGENISSSAAPS
ncbi:uncharacterized protein AMSG_05267 [Thecamonas trahens ATCC 50062]|uniref:UspA domain-containing protein n=1 Tax=Thecamonas trahens ATCC 50062 TaxID=461836 RepID=A0A0L0DAA3_THETB|nr:hypothetical protein AMSG_05267 [Thecamonas trahens ATCC 50062]KNC49272.1 hypothetical protein AMSG_05267 [Thecamonas trahens ATCC 50062]|eukprot:XP_013757986.1 hypothetical protein AMSG_05267 [Thecamonas trahens ATCC 50062]